MTRREQALHLAALELVEVGRYPARFQALARSAVLQDGHTRAERVAFLFCSTLERVRTAGQA